jgi:hypothetical protein
MLLTPIILMAIGSRKAATCSQAISSAKSAVKYLRYLTVRMRRKITTMNIAIWRREKQTRGGTAIFCLSKTIMAMGKIKALFASRWSIGSS